LKKGGHTNHSCKEFRVRKRRGEEEKRRRGEEEKRRRGKRRRGEEEER
jgi:hypothetical protein